MAQQPQIFNVGQAAQPLPSGAAAYGTTIAAGSIPTALSTPGTEGQSVLPITSQFLVGSIPTNSQLATTPQYPQSNNQSAPNMNTSQNSSWLSAIEGYPSDVASTFGGLVKGAFSPEDFTPVGFTPGAAPTARGHFPYNYPITQTDNCKGIGPRPMVRRLACSLVAL